MGIQHLLLLLIYLDPLNVLAAATGKKKNALPKRNPKAKEVNGTVVPTAGTPSITQAVQPKTGNHETCLGYYDVSGQFDKEFECNNTDHRYCCGSCFLRFCCQFKGNRLDQTTCRNYHKPKWVIVPSQAPTPTVGTYDPNLDQTNTTVYITCGVIAFIIVVGVSAKVAYDKATRPPQEMNVHRALADILRQQGPIPISHYERENIAAMDGSPKENTPVRSSSKNHYTPVHTSKTNHGGHYVKENFRSGGPDLHNFISSGFVTLGRGHLKEQQSVDGIGQFEWNIDPDMSTSYRDLQWPVQLQSHCGNHQHNYNHLGLTSPTQTPKNEKPRMNSILTSATEPYDLSFSRSFQSLSHLPPSYESAVKSDLTEKDVDEYYMRKRHLPDLAARGTLPLHVIKMSQEQQGTQRERPRRVQRAMSQDRVLSPERAPPQDYSMSSYGGRILSDEQLLSAERLQSQDPLLSPDKVMSLKRSGFREKAMSRALSHTDVFVSTPVMDRYKMTKMHSHPSASNNSYNTLSINQTASKRQAFASRRTHTVEQLHYIPGHHHHYRTASKTEVTV
ncbi:protein shisa-6 isoform X2 [Lepisosteus oculatus]|uniref:protein shisa-6 isoform X2 n=1 Tax=Lepisosteus oculatus TaxID=7918 RepID=UPI0007400858|nr:PREDICTED: protein shisa-6 homolog isoform X2 [Lepisosteus oculatus]